METTLPEPRAIYQYQKRYIYLEMFLAIMAMSVLLISWIPSLYMHIAYDMVLPSALRAAAFLTSSIGLVIVFIHFIIREFRKIQIITTDERLIVKTPYQMKMILFSEVVSVKFVRLPIHHGFLIIKTSQTTIKIPLYIEKMDALVQDIATGLVRYNSIDIFDKKTVTDLNVASVVYRKAYVRGEHALIPVLSVSLMMFLFNMFIGNQFWGIDMVQLFIWSCSGIIIPPLVYFSADMAINHVVKDSIINQRSPIQSESVFLFVSIVVIMLYFIAGWSFKTFLL